MNTKYRNINIENLFEQLCINKGKLYMIEISKNEDIYREYVCQCQKNVLEKIIKNYELNINKKTIKGILNGLRQYTTKDEQYLMEYFELLEKCFYWNERNFIYQEYMNIPYRDDVILSLYEKSNEMYKNIFDFKKNKKIIKEINLIEMINECKNGCKRSRDTYVLAYCIQRLKSIVKNKIFLEVLIESVMFKSGYTVRRYITDEGIHDLVMKIENRSIEDIEADILRIYLSNYEKLVNEIIDKNKKLEKCKKNRRNESLIREYFIDNKNVYITKSDIMNKYKYNMSEITVKRKILLLKKEGTIEKTGAKKNAKYKYCGGKNDYR